LGSLTNRHQDGIGSAKVALKSDFKTGGENLRQPRWKSSQMTLDVFLGTKAKVGHNLDAD